MSKYRAVHGLSLPDGGRVEEGEEFDGEDAGNSLDWLEKQGHIEKVEDKPAKPVVVKAGTKEG